MFRCGLDVTIPMLFGRIFHSVVFVILVASHLIVDAKYVPRNTKVVNSCVAQTGDECKAKVTATRQEDTNVIIDFTPNTCSGTEKINYKIGVVEGSASILAPGVAIIFGTSIDLTCENIDIETITTTTDGDFCDFYEHKTVPPSATDVKYKPVVNNNQKIELSWSYPEDMLEKCPTQIQFSVAFGAVEPIICPESPCEIDVSTVAACDTIEMTVTAQIGTTNAATAGKVTYAQPLPSVKVREVFPDPESEGGFVITSFDPLEGVDEAKCGKVHYQVEQVGGECFSSDIIVYVVAPIPNIITPSVPKSVNNGPGQVLNAAYELIGGLVNVTWGVPVDGDDCNLWYEITYVKGATPGDTTVATTHGTYVPIPNNAMACTKNPIIVQATNGVAGRPVTLQVEGEFGGVSDLACTMVAKEVTCNWSVPDNADACNVEYAIVYSDGGPKPIEKEPISEVEFKFNVADCSGNIWIKVTPVTYFGTEGAEPRDGIPTERAVDIDSTCTKQSSTKSWWKYFL